MGGDWFVLHVNKLSLVLYSKADGAAEENKAHQTIEAASEWGYRMGFIMISFIYNIFNVWAWKEKVNASTFVWLFSSLWSLCYKAQFSWSEPCACRLCLLGNDAHWLPSIKLFLIHSVPLSFPPACSNATKTRKNGAHALLRTLLLSCTEEKMSEREQMRDLFQCSVLVAAIYLTAAWWWIFFRSMETECACSWHWYLRPLSEMECMLSEIGHRKQTKKKRKKLWVTIYPAGVAFPYFFSSRTCQHLPMLWLCKGCATWCVDESVWRVCGWHRGWRMAAAVTCSHRPRIMDIEILEHEEQLPVWGGCTV